MIKYKIKYQKSDVIPELIKILEKKIVSHLMMLCLLARLLSDIIPSIPMATHYAYNFS